MKSAHFIETVKIFWKITKNCVGVIIVKLESLDEIFDGNCDLRLSGISSNNFEEPKNNETTVKTKL